MKLKSFKKNKKLKTTLLSLGALALLGVGILIFRSYALYKETKSYNILRGTIPDFSSGDIELTFTIDGQVVDQAFPSKSDGYGINSVTCENGVTADWDTTNWGIININSNNSKKIKCNVDFKEPTLIEYLKNLQSDEIVEDDFGNLRYIGADPNNYVRFNDELWRIIGVMKDIENADGSKSDKVKLIRSESIGEYSWDNRGRNNWNLSALQQVLNSGAYYNRTSGNCPLGLGGNTTACDFRSTGLTSEAKSMISESVWNLGGTDFASKTTKEFYTLERGTTVATGNPITWTGRVGLMYPSDYGYATSGGATTNRRTCLNTRLGDGGWDGSEVSDCKTNDWLYNSSSDQHTLTPKSSTNSTVSSLFRVYSSGYVSTGGSNNGCATYPVVYLDSGVGIESGGTGSSSSPFVLKVQ